MKNILFLFLSFLLLIPNLTSAHTALSSSNPKDGETISGPLNEFTLNFETEIEPISTMSVFKGEEEISFQQVEVKERQMIGTLSASLDNGSYVINWKIVGKDGHTITGEVPFIVQKVVEEEVQEQPTENQETLEKQEESIKEEVDQAENESQETKNKQSNGLSTTLIIAVLGLILIIGFIFVFRKKK